MEIKKAIDFAQDYLDYDIAELQDVKNRLGKKQRKNGLPGERKVEILEERMEILKTIIHALRKFQQEVE